MRAPKRAPYRPGALALSAKPAAVRADDFAASQAMLQVGRLGRLWHSAWIGSAERLGNISVCASDRQPLDIKLRQRLLRSQIHNFQVSPKVSGPTIKLSRRQILSDGLSI